MIYFFTHTYTHLLMICEDVFTCNTNVTTRQPIIVCFSHLIYTLSFQWALFKDAAIFFTHASNVRWYYIKTKESKHNSQKKIKRKNQSHVYIYIYIYTYIYIACHSCLRIYFQGTISEHDPYIQNTDLFFNVISKDKTKQIAINKWNIYIYIYMYVYMYV